VIFTRYLSYKLPCLTLAFIIAFQINVTRSSAQSFSISPDIRFENFNAGHNFINNYVGNATIDQDGYLWTSSDGIYRFDGINFTRFTNYNNQHHGLKANYSDDLLSDKWGRLWVGNIAGLCYYDRNQNQFKYINSNGADPIKYAFAYCIVKDELWFVCNYGLCKINLRSLEVTRTSLENILDPIKTFPVDDNTLLISSREYYYIYNIPSNTFSRKTLIENNVVIRISDVVRKKDTLWIASNKGLWKTKTINESLQIVPGTVNMIIRSLVFHPADKFKNYLWLATDNGLQVFSTNSGLVTNIFLHDAADPYSIMANSITNLYTDKQENLWICTEKGISLFDYRNQAWKTRLLSFQDQIADDYIRSIKQDLYDSNMVWIASQKRGITLYNWAEKQPVKQINLMKAGTGKPSPDVMDMVQVSKNGWVFLKKNEVISWDALSGIKKSSGKINLPDTVLQSMQFYKLINAGKYGIYILSNRGMFVYHPENNQVENVLLREFKLQALSSYDMINGRYDGEHNIWIASRKGLVKYDILLKKADIYYNRKTTDTLRSNFLNDVIIGKGKIYCAYGEGIHIFDTASKTFESINIFDNIHNPACYTLMLEDGLIWINSNAGLIIFDPIKKTSRIFNIKSTSTPSYSVSSFAAIQKSIVIPFRDAYSYFDPALLLKSFPPSIPVIEDVFVNNLPYNYTIGNSLSLTHNQNNIRFAFTAFDFNNPEKIRFRYQLKGVNKAWIYATGERNANYIQLPPGQYTFVVQSGNEDGTWNDKVKSLQFNIVPAFWQTSIFKALVVIIIALLIVLFFKRRLEGIRKRAGLKQLMAETEMKALRAQMNPHFIFNCLATADGFILQNKKLEASEFLNKFSRLIRMVLENSQHSLIPVHAELAALKLYLQLEQVRHQDMFQYEFDIDEDIEADLVYIPPLLLQPYIENAILHGLRHKTTNDGFLKISLQLKNGHMECVVDDNGIGRVNAAQLNQHMQVSHHSMGLAVTLNRIESIEAIYNRKATVTIIDKPNHSGTLVKITLPVFKK
jgi:ligand-binding sensor domain-containing protein